MARLFLPATLMAFLLSVALPSFIAEAAESAVKNDRNDILCTTGGMETPDVGLLWIWNDSNDIGRDQVGDDPGPYFLEKSKPPAPIKDMKTMFYGLKMAVNTSFSFDQGATFSMLFLKDPRKSKNHLGSVPRKILMPRKVVGGCIEYPTQADPKDQRQFVLSDQFQCWGSGRAMVGVRQGNQELDTIGNCFAVSKDLRKPKARQILNAVVVIPNLPWECALAEAQESSVMKAEMNSGILQKLMGTVSDEKEYDAGIFRKLMGKEIKACARFLKGMGSDAGILPNKATSAPGVGERPVKPRTGIQGRDGKQVSDQEAHTLE